MDRTAHYPVAPGQRAASGHITTPPSTTNNMIGPSPSYVPNDYNDIQAVFYSRGGYPQPPSGGAPSASISASYFPPPPAAAGNVYGSPPYAGQAYDQRYASPEQQAPGAARHSVSPRTGYEGWKDATDSTYSGLPNAATTTSMDSMTGAFSSANGERNNRLGGGWKSLKPLTQSNRTSNLLPTARPPTISPRHRWSRIAPVSASTRPHRTSKPPAPIPRTTRLQPKYTITSALVDPSPSSLSCSPLLIRSQSFDTYLLSLRRPRAAGSLEARECSRE